MNSNDKSDLEILDENLEKAYIDSEFEELTDYFIAVNSGKEVEDPRPRMSFINDEIEKKAKDYADYVSAVIDVFDGKLVKR